MDASWPAVPSSWPVAAPSSWAAAGGGEAEGRRIEEGGRKHGGGRDLHYWRIKSQNQANPGVAVFKKIQVV